MSILLLNNKLVIFKKDSCGSHDLTTGIFDEKPKAIPSVFNIPYSTIDCALGWDDGHLYFFKGMDCIKYNVKKHTVVAGYPKKLLFEFPGIWMSDIGEAMKVGNKAYFFRKTQFMRYDIDLHKADTGYPMIITEGWTNIGESIDGAEYLGGDKVIFLKGDAIQQYDLGLDRVDPEFPITIRDYLEESRYLINNNSIFKETKKMAQIYYDVELIVQEQNPICWVACCAMAKGWGTQSSVGVGEFTDGFDPSNSCISNLAGSWQDCTDLMETWGFSMYSVYELSANGTFTADDLHTALSEYGPAVLLHTCQNFPYGSQWSDNTSMTGAHAVLITGVDTDNNLAYFNNPWGDKDQSTDLSIFIQKINSDSSLGKTFGFWQKWE